MVDDDRVQFLLGGEGGLRTSAEIAVQTAYGTCTYGVFTDAGRRQGHCGVRSCLRVPVVCLIFHSLAVTMNQE
jgi:hypothetical protein